MIAAFTEWFTARADDSITTILLLGVILSLSIGADWVAKRTRIPRISILVMLGVALAVVQQVALDQPAGSVLSELKEPLIQLALVMVAFLLGSELTLERMRKTGALIIGVSVIVVLVSYLFVGIGLFALGFPLAVAITLAAISVATDPAAVNESVHESGRGLVAKVLLGIVAIDDGWGILVFGLSMAALGWMLSNDGATQLLHAVWELGGAVILGILIGLPSAWLSGRLKQGQPILIESLAIMFLLAGLSSLLGVSELLASMVAGALVANFSYHHTRSFKEIEHIEWPFLVFFFVLSGASIDLYQLSDAILLIAAYFVLRLAGRYAGGLVAVKLMQRRHRGGLPCNIGLALTPQAGVAIGMALLAAERFPDYSSLILPAVVASTVVFEVIGPLCIRQVANTRHS